MLFALLTIFTEDNTAQLTRQSISWGASTLCCEGLSHQHQTSSVCCPQFPQAPAGRMPWADCLGSIQNSVKSRRILVIESLPPGTQGESSYFSFLSLCTPWGALGFALGQTSRVQGKKTGEGGEKISLKLSILHPEMGRKSVVLLQGISCYNFFFTLPLANSSIKESWFFFPCHPWGVHYCKQ